MTAIVSAQPTAKRISKIIRLNFLNPWPYLITPWIIIGFLMTFTFVLGLTGVAGLSADGVVLFRPAYFIVIYLFVIANQTLYHQFPLALSYGVTRKDFYLGTVISALITSLVFAIGAGLVALVMGDIDLTAPEALTHQGFLLIWVFFTSQLLAITLTALYLRWRAAGLTSFFIGLGVVVVTLPFIADVWDNADRVMRFIFASEQLLVGWTIAAALTSALFLAGYWLISRAAPNRT